MYENKVWDFFFLIREHSLYGGVTNLEHIIQFLYNELERVLYFHGLFSIVFYRSLCSVNIIN